MLGSRIFCTISLSLLTFISVLAQPFGVPVEGEHGMVVSARAEAAEAGVEILQKGGNAIDAAVATGFAEAVVYPVAGNIGGGGFMVIRMADGSVTSFDYREKAPGNAHRDMYLDQDGEYLTELSKVGGLASGVPGSVAGLLKAHERFGTLPREVVMAPAIRLAEHGYPLTKRQAARFNHSYDNFSEFESTARYFTKGHPDSTYKTGELFVQKDLAETLKRISNEGRDGFYKGEIADLIVAEMERTGGIISHEDLEQYEPVERQPVIGTYRGYKIISMAPPSSGGIALIQLLNAVEPYPIGEMGLMSSETLHLMGEAMRRTYADRAQWLGDSDYFEVPIDGLTSKDYTDRRMADFSPYRADSSTAITYGDPLAYESQETMHYSVVDDQGNAVSVTTTLNGGFGSKVVVDGAGFFMNNEMDDFSAKPGEPNMFGLIGAEANAIEPGKRMLSSMTPTIVEDPEGRLFLVIGTPGGGTIITTVFQVILNLIDHGLSIQEAVAMPRIHHQWLPDVMFHEQFALPADVMRNLQARGWTLDARSGFVGSANGIIVEYDYTQTDLDPSGLMESEAVREGRLYLGGADPRGDNTAVGY